MASTFANAFFTIIAEQGRHANFGLRGLRGISKARNLSQQAFNFDDGSQAIIRQPFRCWSSATSPKASLWSKRGWTSQEDQFSHRRICFFNDTVRWECDSAMWCEDREITENWHDDFTNKQGYTGREVFTDPYPNIGRYNNLVQIYNVKQFTHPEDVLEAFLGITSALSFKFNGGFLCGLPVMFFDASLLWQPTNLLRRRTAPKPTPSRLPSWSWAGWHGRVTASYFQDDFQSYIKQDHFWRPEKHIIHTTPLVDWSYQEKLSLETIQLHSDWYAYKNSKLGEDNALPAGWSRHAHFKEDIDWYGDRQSLPSVFYIHVSLPKIGFWHPIPLCDQSERPVIRPMGGALLSCRTRRAWFTLFQTFKSKQGSHFASLHNDIGTYAGILRLHNKLETMKNPASRTICELVAISKGYTVETYVPESIQLYEFMIEGGPQKGQRYDFYNVLWVEWEDGIAYRKAIGRIEKNMWESANLEWIDLLLG